MSLSSTHQTAVFPAALVLALGLAVTLIAFGYAYLYEKKAQETSFKLRAEHYLVDVGRAMDDVVYTSQLLNRACSTFAEVTREKFDAYATLLKGHHPYIASLGYQRLVRHAERSDFERSRADQFAGGTIAQIQDGIRTVSPERPVYHVIDYAVPPESVGIDASSFPQGDDAGQRAIRTGRAAASNLFRLTQDQDEHMEFRLLVPLYRAAPRPPAGASGWDDIAGFTAVVIRPDILFQSLYASLGHVAEAPVDFMVFSGRQAAPAALLYSSQAARTVPGAYPGWCWLACRPLSLARTYDWAGKPWHVVVWGQPQALLAQHGGAFGLLVAGLFASIAASLLVKSQQAQTFRVVDLVTRRTAELRSLNTILLNDIQERRHLTDELARSQQELRALAEHNARVKEDERKRIAREIHDDLGQSMLALRIDLSLMADGEPQDITNERIKRALVQIDNTMGAMRMIINEMRPAVLDLGLDAAVEWEVAKFHRRTGIECVLNIRDDQLQLGDDISTALYRIVQESMTNIMRHAQASRVELELWTENGWVFLKLGDNGIGMAEHCRRKAKSFGLIGIAERIYALGGAFDTESRPGLGTRLTIAVPFAATTGLGTA